MSCDCFVALPHDATCLQLVIVVFPDHTHLLFIITYTRGRLSSKIVAYSLAL